MKPKNKKTYIVIAVVTLLVLAAAAAAIFLIIPALRDKQEKTDEKLPAQAGYSGFTSTDELKDKHVGVMRGSIYEGIMAKYMPDAKVSLYDKAGDMAVAVSNGEIDSFICSDIQANALVSETEGLRILGGFPEKSEIAFAFPKNDKGAQLRDEFNEYIEKIKADGTLEKLSDKWMNGEDKNVDIYASDGKKGALKMATTGTTEPYTFMYNGRLVGLDIDIAARFSREYGYDLDISVMEFGAIIPGLSSGSYDFAGANIAVTDERAESVYFSESYTENEIAFVVKDAGQAS